MKPIFYLNKICCANTFARHCMHEYIRACVSESAVDRDRGSAVYENKRWRKQNGSCASETTTATRRQSTATSKISTEHTATEVFTPTERPGAEFERPNGAIIIKFVLKRSKNDEPNLELDVRDCKQTNFKSI